MTFRTPKINNIAAIKRFFNSLINSLAARSAAYDRGQEQNQEVTTESVITTASLQLAPTLASAAEALSSKDLHAPGVRKSICEVYNKLAAHKRGRDSRRETFQEILRYHSLNLTSKAENEISRANRLIDENTQGRQSVRNKETAEKNNV